MPDPLDPIRHLAGRPRDAIRWACVLEATAPKAGNVYPGRTFDDLTYVDFIAAAEIASKRIGRAGFPVSQRILQAVKETVALTNTNVNLGIVLLLGPLVAADEAMIKDEPAMRTDSAWKTAIQRVLSGFDQTDSKLLLQAIAGASAGGLGEVDEMDVRDSSGAVDIIEAMKLAAGRDRIARQYAGGFADLVDQVVPVVWKSISEAGDVLAGICRAHLRLLSLEPDSLIERKNGREVADSVQTHAQKVDLDDSSSIARFDASLRSNAHKLNPGTTADLIAAALYVLLRTPTR